VLDDPGKNTKEYLTNRAKELNDMSDAELKKLMASAREKAKAVEAQMEEDMKKDFRVK
jgi:diadenosine tetraphosphate (Ap4A) HIT family hydrolase